MAELAIQLKLATMVDRVTSAVSHIDCTLRGIDPEAGLSRHGDNSRVESLGNKKPFPPRSDLGRGQHDAPRQLTLAVSIPLWRKSVADIARTRSDGGIGIENRLSRTARRR